MRKWIKPMRASPYPPLVEMGAQVEVKVTQAGKAVDELNAAEQRNREFRATGDRRKLIDAFNALRKSTYGKLAEMPHAQPQLKLPRNFADRFFRPERSAAATKPLTAAEIEEKLTAAKKRVEELEQQLDKAKKVEAEKAADKAKEQLTIDKQELADVQAEKEKLAAKEAALKAKIGES